MAECPEIVCSMAAAREPFSASLMAMKLICGCFLLRVADGMYDNPLLVSSRMEPFVTEKSFLQAEKNFTRTARPCV